MIIAIELEGGGRNLESRMAGTSEVFKIQDNL